MSQKRIYEGPYNNRIDRVSQSGNSFKVEGVPNHVLKTDCFISETVELTRRRHADIDDVVGGNAPDFESDKLKKENIFRLLFPKDTYNETNIYTHTSNLLQLLCDFMAQTAFESNNVQKKLLEHAINDDTSRGGGGRAFCAPSPSLRLLFPLREQHPNK